MGACACGSSIKSKQIQSKQKFDTFKSENFMLRDYSLTIGLSKSMFEIKTIIHNYRPNDIRLIKRTYEETNVHSHVLTVLKMEVKKDFVEEISLLIEYTRNGFEISLGSLDEIKKICKIENFQTEKVHFARSDLTCTGGLHQILD